MPRASSSVAIRAAQAEGRFAAVARGRARSRTRCVAKSSSKQAGELPCRCPVEREFRRPIAYDVDYVYKGAKFRSRLPEDPGNRLRIRVSVTPGRGAASAAERAIAELPGLRPPRAACEHSRPDERPTYADADVLTSARMAAGMTSRARRPDAANPGWVTVATPFVVHTRKAQPRAGLFCFRSSATTDVPADTEPHPP